MRRFQSRRLALRPILWLVLLQCFCFQLRCHTVDALYQDKPEVTMLESMEQFDSTVMKSDNLWMIQFCDSSLDSCLKMVNAYVTLATLMKGIIRFGFVSLDQEGGHSIVAHHQIDTTTVLPAMYWFLDDKNAPSKVIAQPQDISLEAIVGNIMSTFAETISARAKALNLNMQFTPENDSQQQQKEGGRSGSSKKQDKKRSKKGQATVEVKGEDEWDQKVLQSPLVTLVAFTAPWCGHCKMLKPEWDEAASKLEGHGAQLVWVDATDASNERLAGQFQVKGFPTIYVFPGGAPKSASAARQYPGERKAEFLVQYALEEVDKTGVPKEIPQLISADVLKDECDGHNHICVLAALPHIFDSGASGRNQYKDLLAKVAKKFRGSAFSFLWFEGGSQPELETSLELTFGFPALVAYSMDRHAYAVLHGSFSEKAMSSFLHGVTSGRVPVVKLAQEKVPKVETTELWDGLDAAPPEEEFDLADIMGWDDDDEEAKPNDEL